MQTIRKWLEANGLGQYAADFEANDVDVDILSSLTEDDLHRLGVSLGHRKRILRALEAAGTDAGAAPNAIEQSSATIESLTAQGERRQVTVLFCDLVGSTALSNMHDPEEYRAILSRYHETCIAAIQRYDGYVAQIQGDGVVAYFGYPLAHEGEAERAVRAGLSVVQRLSQLDSGLAEVLRVRIGVASGLVVVSHVLAPDKSAVGETPNMAARLQTLAQPGEVMISERTRLLAGGAFDYEDRGVHELKGIAEPTRAWKVLGASAAQSRFEAATRGLLTPMVGREQEIGLLLDRWELSRASEGQVVLLQGAPGIGKSRMLRAFRERLPSRIEVTLSYQCSPYYTNSAFYPIADHLERTLGFAPQDTPGHRLDKLEQRFIGELRRSHTDCSLIARALSIPCDERYGSLEMSPQRQKDETVRVFVDTVATIAHAQATAMLFEDAHWADPSTLEVLNALIDCAETLPLLVLITYRPEFQPPWLARAHVTPLSLTRLSRAQGASIVLRVANDKPLPADLVTQIVDKTDGVPLFLEELTKAVIESNMVHELGDRYEYSGKVEKLSIPNTLRDSLMARLDRLIPVKELAQIGAVLGREFSYELMQAVSPMSEVQLNEALDKLVASELVFRRGTAPNATYIFKHALVQDTAYESLLKGKRQQLHAQIADAIAQRFPSKAETEPELLAHHYTEAGMISTALRYWKAAGELAQRRIALQEAIMHYERGLGLISQMRPSRERDTYELQLRALLGMAWVGLQGYTHPQVAANLEPALRLDQSLDAGDYRLRILWGLWVYCLCSGRVKESLSWAHRLLAAADELSSENMGLAGNWTACNSHYYLGNFSQSVVHADVILTRYDTERDKHIADLINHDPKTIALAYKAAAEWALGFPERAAKDAHAAITHANERKHAFDVCWVHVFTAHWVFGNMRDAKAADKSLQECERLARDQRLLFFSDVYCPLVRGVWLLSLDRGQEAEAQLREAIPKWLGAGMNLGGPDSKSRRADALLSGSSVESALALLDESLDQILREDSRERFSLSNVLRIKACAFQRRGDADRAKAAFEEAVNVAREQNAKSWELRAATSYARFLSLQNSKAEALSILQPVYDWFTEGHDTRDLCEAAALLAELK